MKIVRIALLAAIILSFALMNPFAGSGTGDTVSVQATGSAPVSGGVSDATKQQAYDAAKADAVTRGASTYVMSNIEKNNFGVASVRSQYIQNIAGGLTPTGYSAIFHPNAAYARALKDPAGVAAGSYRVVSEGVQGDQYVVTIAADISKERMLLELSNLGVLQNHKVIFNIDEYFDGKPDPSSICENTLTHHLLIDNFRIIDKTQLDQVKMHDYLAAALGGNLKQAQLVATQYGADVVIFGKVETAIIKATAGYHARVTLSLKAVKSDNAQVIYDEVFEDKTSGPPVLTPETARNNAMKKVGLSAADSVSINVPSKWAMEAIQGHEIRLTIHNASTSHVEKIRAYIESIPAFVEFIGPGTFTAGVYIIEVKISASPAELSKMLEKHNFKTFKMQTVDYQGDTLTVRVAKK